MDVTTATPAAIDAQLAEIQHEQAAVVARIDSAHRAQLNHARATNPSPLATRAADKADADLPRLRDEYAALDARRAPLDNEYLRRGGWTRYYLVNNPDGHVHSHTHCSTCRVTTQFRWLTDMSGGTRESVVELAGERACTVCFPDAPVDVLRRRSEFRSDPEIERAERVAAGAAAKAAKAEKAAEKAITNPDGTPLAVPTWGTRTEVIRTVATAWRELVDEHWNSDHYGRPLDEREQEKCRLIVEALAAKLNQTGAEVLHTLADKVAAKHKREGTSRR